MTVWCRCQRFEIMCCRSKNPYDRLVYQNENFLDTKYTNLLRNKLLANVWLLAKYNFTALRHTFPKLSISVGAQNWSLRLFHVFPVDVDCQELQNRLSSSVVGRGVSETFSLRRTAQRKCWSSNELLITKLAVLFLCGLRQCFLFAWP